MGIGESLEAPRIGDRSWMVATEIDLVATHIGGSDRLSDELVADDQIEAIRVEPHHSVCLDRSRFR